MVTSHDQVFLNSVVEETILLRDKTLRYFEGTPRAYELDEKKKRKTAIKSQNALDKRKEHVSLSFSEVSSSLDVTTRSNGLYNKEEPPPNKVEMITSRRIYIEPKTRTQCVDWRFQIAHGQKQTKEVRLQIYT